MAHNFWETNEGFLVFKRLRESIETHTTVMADCLEKIRQAIEDNTLALEDIKREMHDNSISLLNSMNTNSIIVEPQQSANRKKKDK